VDTVAPVPLSRPLRVLMVALNFHPEPTGSGVYNGDLAFWLAERGHRVEVVTAPPHYPGWRRHPAYRYGRWMRERVHGVEVFRCPILLPSTPRGMRRIVFLASFAASAAPVALARARVLRPDWVVCVEPTLLSLPLGLAAARTARARLWYHVDDIELVAAATIDGMRAFAGAARGLYSALVARADVVSTITETMRERLVDLGARPERCRLVPRWIEPAGFDREAGMRLREQLGVPSEHPLVLYAGGMGAKQGIEQLAPLVECVEASTVRFVFCGNGPLRRLLDERLGGDPRVRLLDPLPDAEYRALMAAADVHLLLQRADTTVFCMPSKLSAMLATEGVIVAQAAAGSELARLLEGIAWVVEPGDVVGLATTVERAIAERAHPRDQTLEARRRLLAAWERRSVLARVEGEMVARVD